MSTKNFDRCLRSLLTISGVTCEELARHLGVNVPAVRRWMNGLCVPDMYQFREIARFFGLPYAWFLDGGEGFPGVEELADRLRMKQEEFLLPSNTCLLNSDPKTVSSQAEFATSWIALEDEALYMVGGTAYLHIRTSDDDRIYTHDDCYTTYDYALYDKEMHQFESGRMEVVEDAREIPKVNFYFAAQNILECNTLLGGSSIEIVPMNLLRETVCPASRRSAKPSILKSLHQCQREAEKNHDRDSTTAPRRDSER